MTQAEKDFIQTFARNLRLARAHAGISASDLSTAIGSRSKKRITDLEYARNCMPNMREIIAISENLGVSIGHLTGGEPSLNWTVKELGGEV